MNAGSGQTCQSNRRLTQGVVLLALFALTPSLPPARAAQEADAFPDIQSITRKIQQSFVTIAHKDRRRDSDGVGAGFIISEDGLIATALHVIGESQPITVQMNDGRELEVERIHAWDRALDLAVLRVDADGLIPLELFDSDKLEQGQEVVAFGNPQGLENSVVRGLVSAFREFEASTMIQLAVPVEPGNSGGPVADRQGRVVGIMTLKSAYSDNIGLAMPVNALKKILETPNPVPMERWLNRRRLDPKLWEVVMGARWHRDVDRIEVAGYGEGFGGRALCLRSEEFEERPLEASVWVRLENESGAAGLAFASDGSQRHYGFYPSNGRLRLTRFNGWDVYSWTILEETESEYYRPGEWNHLKVRQTENRVTCWINGRRVFERDEDILQGARVGLAKFRNTRAGFRKFQVGRSLSNPFPSSAKRQRLQELLSMASLAEPNVPSDNLQKLLEDPQATRLVVGQHVRSLERQAAEWKKLAHQLHKQWVEKALVQELQKNESHINLFRAAMLIAKLDQPELDMEVYQNLVEEMASEVQIESAANRRSEWMLEQLDRYLFRQEGFHPARTDYYNRSNSYMNRVLEDRQGIPLTLSILYLELGHRLGLENLVGLSVPRHFLVGWQGKDGEVQLIDVYNRAKRLSAEEASLLIGNDLKPSEVKPASKKEMILRMLRNLVGIAMQEGDVQSILRYLDLVLLIDPEAGIERWSRAAYRLQSGNREGARRDLEILLEQKPDSVNLERITEVYENLRSID